MIMTAARYNVSHIRREKLFAQVTLSNIRNVGAIRLDSLDIVCRLTGFPVEELIEYVPDEKDGEHDIT